MSLYAIYSEKQRQAILNDRIDKIGNNHPSIVEYERANGERVLCTDVELKPGCPGCHWDDKVDLGEVVKFVRAVE